MLVGAEEEQPRMLTGLFTLLGVILGALITHLLSINRSTAERSLSLKSRMAALESEVRDNIKLTEKPLIDHGKVMLLAEQWKAARPYLLNLPNDLVFSLRDAYVEVERHYSLVDQARATEKWGEGLWDASIRKQAEVTKAALEGALDHLVLYNGPGSRSDAAESGPDHGS